MAKTPRDDCIERIVTAAGGKLSREEVADELDKLLARAESQGPSWKAMDEKLREAAAEMEDAVMERAAAARRAERLQALRAIKRHRYYDAAPSPAVGLEAKLGGVNEPFEGFRNSVEAGYKGRRRRLLGGFWLDLERAELNKTFLSQTLEREWATELRQLNQAKGGRPGLTGSPDALKIAEIIQRWQNSAIAMVNGEGGWVKSYSGYIARTSHDADRIRRAGRERWVDDVMQWLDVRRTFHDDDPNQARKLLADLYPQFVHGDHFDYNRPFDDAVSLIDVDFARRASAPRELHWQDADSDLAYNAAYGRFRPTFAVTHAFENTARVSALMHEFGPLPRRALEEDLYYLRAKHKQNWEFMRQLDKREGLIRSMFALFDGTANRPVHTVAARIFADVRSVQRMSKLGLTPFSLLSDLAFKSSELRYQGMAFGERHLTALGDYFKGAKGSDKQAVADLLRHGFDSEIGMIAQRFDFGGTTHNAIARAEQRFFRLTGMNAMTFNQRHAAERIMAAHWGMQRGKAFAQLDAAERRILSGYEIGAKEWELLKRADWDEIGGDTYLTPQVATRLSDADLRRYLVASGGLHKEIAARGGPHVEAAVRDVREDLANRLAAYFADRGEYAVLEPGARERAKLYGGGRDWAPGTVKGETLRLFMQFKQFPLVVAMKAWARDLYGGQERSGMLLGFAEFIAYSSLLGIMANGLNRTVKGQDPLAEWRHNPAGALLRGFIRGGAASIYGDFLLGEWSRHGLLLSQSLLGPTIGQVDKVGEIWSDLTHMKGRAATAMLGLRLARDNAPFMNMIVTKYAVDALIYWRLAEWLSPGFLRRHERFMREKVGIEYLDGLRPSQVAQ